MMFVPKAAVFDMDGLMFNTEQIFVDVADVVLGRRGKKFSSELHKALMGRPARDGLRIMLDWHGLLDTPEQIAEESSVVFLELLPSRLAPMPGLLDILARFEAAGVRKAVATSSGRAFAEQVLGMYDLIPRFEFLLCAEDVVRGKPHPEIYWKAAERLGVDPGEMVVFEDSQNGFRAARDSGAQAVAVPGDHNDGHEYDGAFCVARALDDPDMLQRIGLLNAA